jgi:beige protein homolog 1
MLWDLNRQCFVRELPADGPVEVGTIVRNSRGVFFTDGPKCARINDATGTIMICRGSRISLYSLNGALLLDQAAHETTDDRIVSCAFYEGSGNEWLERELIFTGHRKGIVNVRNTGVLNFPLSLLISLSSLTVDQIWSKAIRKGHFELDLIRQLHHVDSNRDNGANISAAICCILPLPLIVYTSDEAGRVVSHWILLSVVRSHVLLTTISSMNGIVSYGHDRHPYSSLDIVETRRAIDFVSLFHLFSSTIETSARGR